MNFVPIGTMKLKVFAKCTVEQPRLNTFSHSSLQLLSAGEERVMPGLRESPLEQNYLLDLLLALS
jgi:hypothetical protein